MRINNEFYKLNALELAPFLLGKILCRNVDGQLMKARIVETESYFGTEDSACHAHNGKTERNKIMFKCGGYTYIYLCYGMHYLLNIVSGEKNHPEAVLLRGAVLVDDQNEFSDIYNKNCKENLNGPAKLTKALNIDKNLNSENLKTSNQIWLEDDNFHCEFISLKRVGIDYASEEYRNKLWRFKIK